MSPYTSLKPGKVLQQKHFNLFTLKIVLKLIAYRQKDDFDMYKNGETFHNCKYKTILKTMEIWLFF